MECCVVCQRISPEALSLISVNGNEHPIHDMNWKSAKKAGLNCASRFCADLRASGVEFKVRASKKLQELRAKREAEKRESENRQAWIAAGLDPKKFGAKKSGSAD